MGLQLAPEAAERLASLDPEIRGAGEAIGVAVAAQLTTLKPGMAAGADEPVLTALTLEPEGDADPVSLAACLAAHRAYVRGRGDPEGVSTGALALARLLVWGQRAALLGKAPKIRWIGPEARRPGDTEGLAITAECVVESGGKRRRARAVAIVSTT